METSPSSGKSRQRPSLSFVARNVFLLGGLLVMGTLASFLVYGWLSFLGPLQDAEMLTAAEPPPAGISAAKPEDRLRIPESATPAGSAPRTNLKTLSQATHLAPETLPPAVKDDEIAKGDAVFQQFFDAGTWQEKVPLVFDSDRLKTAMQQYYAIGGRTDARPGAADSVGIYRIGSTVVQLRVYRDLRDGNNLEIALRRQANGTYLLDWECYVGAGALSWEDFLRDKPTQPVLFRAYVTIGDHYTQEFADAQRFLCVQLTSADRSRFFYAYCERQSSAARGLNGVLTENSLTPVTLRLSFPSGVSSTDSLKVDELVSPHWLTP